VEVAELPDRKGRLVRVVEYASIEFEEGGEGEEN
jgi:hypothetical protein